MSTFIFEGYEYDQQTGEAQFRYRFDNGRHFKETIRFQQAESFNKAVFERALFLAFVLLGTSYYKTFPTVNVAFETGAVDEWQANFFNMVYQEGLSQYAFENELSRDDLAHFKPTTDVHPTVLEYAGTGVLTLQSGGKDSLLVVSLLARAEASFVPWYLSSTDHHPEVLDTLGQPLVVAKRMLDRTALQKAAKDGANNGHVPVTYIVQSLALLQAILLGKDTVLAAIAHEGEEPHATIGDLNVTHQWSKTWHAEQQFAEYVRRYVSPGLRVGSPLRHLSELRVAELFVRNAWERFGHSFSSCNRANYQQGHDNSSLSWCGECPKCANAYVLFAPFMRPQELQSLFNGQALFTKPLLQETFKGLFGVDGVMKPFECIGETEELRHAYHQAMSLGYGKVSFTVPDGDFDYMQEYDAQDWVRHSLLQ